jgi:hypothetical protein
MMRFLKFIPILLVALVLWACPTYEYKYLEGRLPIYPMNLEDFNTEYDDYNSTAPSMGSLVPFCYSTNRHNQGGDFNIKYEPMNVEFNKTTGNLKVSNEYGGWGIFADEFGVLLNAMERVNSESNELGPNLVYSPYQEFTDAVFVLLYAWDSDGDYDIAYTFNTDSSVFSDSRPVAFLNSEFNDLYPTFDSVFSRIYFCSDREDGVYNIYYAEVEYQNGQIVEILSDTLERAVEMDQVLSGEYDDKCPYIFENTLLFTSNRPGGSGGFDLYYSKFEDGAWTEPVNLGAVINTEFDEYRPILFDEMVDDERDMLVFSSNRTGGNGGFDLYFVGIP